MKPPKRDIVRVVEIEGERGGTQVALVLSCGHWLARRRAPANLSKGIACIGCVVAAAVDA